MKLALKKDKPPKRGYLDGQMLIAMPAMRDERFARSLIYICAHSSDGAMGIVVNQPAANIKFPDLLVQLEVIPAKDLIQLPSSAGTVKVLKGGPVETGRGFVLHSADWGGQDTLQVNGPKGPIFSMTGTIDVLKAIAEGRGPERWLVSLGYAGWETGQLEAEMTRHGWFAADTSEAILFETPTDERWASAFKASGVDPRLLSTETGAA